jgi:hypothetical protein
MQAKDYTAGRNTQHQVVHLGVPYQNVNSTGRNGMQPILASTITAKQHLAAIHLGIVPVPTGYHSTVHAAMRNTPMDYVQSSSDRLVGIEIELNPGDFRKNWLPTQDMLVDTKRFIPSCIVNGAASPYVLVETDGSLKPGGVELVTKPGTLGAHARPLFTLCKIAGVGKNQYGLAPVSLNVFRPNQRSHGQMAMDTRPSVWLPHEGMPNGMHINIDISDLSGRVKDGDAHTRSHVFAMVWSYVASIIGWDDEQRGDMGVSSAVLWGMWALRPTLEYSRNGAHAPFSIVENTALSSTQYQGIGRTRVRGESGAASSVYEARMFRGLLDFDYVVERAAAMVAVADTLASANMKSAADRKLLADCIAPHRTKVEAMQGYAAAYSTLLRLSASNCHNPRGAAFLRDFAAHAEQAVYPPA